MLPVNYRLVETGGPTWVAIRTRPGNIIEQATMQVALQIDEIDAAHQEGWSVLVRGSLQHVDPDVADFRERFDPEPWMAAERDSWLVIEPFAITGRRLHAAEREWAFHIRSYLEPRIRIAVLRRAVGHDAGIASLGAVRDRALGASRRSRSPCLTVTRIRSSSRNRALSRACSRRSRGPMSWVPTGDLAVRQTAHRPIHEVLEAADMTSTTNQGGRGGVATRPLGATWWGLLRIAIGWIFLWSFFDKLFGLGFATCRAEGGSEIDVMCDAAFAKGGAPTFGFLEFGTQGSHAGDLFSWMAPASATSPNLADWLFMIALLAIGVCLVLGVASRLAALGGAALLVFMYLAGFVWPENNPVVDDHLIYACGTRRGSGYWRGAIPRSGRTVEPARGGA